MLLGYGGTTLGAAVLLADAPLGRRLPERVGKEAARFSGWLVEAVPGSGNTPRHRIPQLDSLARHVARGKPKMKALVSTMGKLAEIIYHCLKTGEQYKYQGKYK